MTRYSNMTIWAFLGLNAIILSSLIMTSVYAAVALCVGVTLIILLYNSPDRLLEILLFIFPFSGTILLKDSFVPIPGFKPLQLLALAATAVALYNYRKAVNVPPFAIIFFGIVIAVFSISILHSLMYLDSINSFLLDPLPPGRYFLSMYLKPMIFILPAVFMIKFIYRKKDMDCVVGTIDWSITALAVLIIIIYLRNRSLLTSNDDVRDLLHLTLGTHTNNLANYFIIGFPFVLARFFKNRSYLGYLKIAIVGIGVALLFSRSAYFLFIMTFFLYTYFSKRLKIIPVVLCILLLAVMFVVPKNVIQRASKGFDTADRNELFAGRLDGLWGPFIDEYSTDYKAILIGKGRYAILSTKAHKMGISLQSMHPHNMYLEMVMDAGIFGLSLFIGLFGVLLNKCFLYLKYLRGDYLSEYLTAVITSLICFLISGFTDRTLFPDEINGYLWIIIAMAIIIFRYAKHGEPTSA